MEKTLRVGDFLFVNKAAYGAQIPGTAARLPHFTEPSRGEVVVFPYPRDPSLNFVKRVIGVGRHVVEMRGGTVRVNGRTRPEACVRPRYPGHDITAAMFTWRGT